MNIDRSDLSESNLEVVGWDSKLDSDEKVLVRDASTEACQSQQEVSDKNIGTQETKEIGIQTTTQVLSNSNEETDKKLAAWLRKIMPALEKELLEGPTAHDGQHERSSTNFVSVLEFQQIDVKRDREVSEPASIVGHFQWLSVILQNHPVLVIAVDNLQESTSYLLLYEPFYSKDGNVYWKEVASYPIKQLKYLVVNSENRDIFAGASNSGDLFVWEYVKSASATSQSQIVEIFSKACEDTICGITFLSENHFLCCFANEGNLISYKIVGKQNCTIDKIMKIEQRRLKDSSITAIAAIDKSNNFVIGLLSGKIFYCSTNQCTDGNTDPIIKELTSQNFAVTALKHIRDSSDRNLIISFDVSNEIFIHELEDDSNEKSLKYVIRLPLPIKNSIAITRNLEHIFCSLTNGLLEIFNARNHTRKVIDGNKSGNNVAVELSRNESWLIMGVSEGLCKIYRLSYEDE